MQPQIHLIDETWIQAPPEVAAAAVADPANWTRWWPGLIVRVSRDRGAKGMQWTAHGPYRGTVEIWLEPFGTGVILHHYLRLDPADGRRLRARAAERQTRRFAWHAKRVFWRLKDELGGNLPQWPTSPPNRSPSVPRRTP
jgi:hypothetical protein